MLPANLINAIQTLSRSGKPLVVADAPNPAAKIQAGQQLQGVIQSQVSPGLFKVLVAGLTVQIRLPGTPRGGDVINLRVVTKSPQLTFSIAASTSPISTQEQIGSAARLLANLAELPLEKSLPRQPAGPAVWQTSGIAPDSKLLALALRDELANSGLFYESHQAQWVSGERSTAQLLVEPQNQLLDQRIAGTNQTEVSTTPATTQSDTITLNRLDSGTVAKELFPLVQQQLHALETHQLTWTGQVWPGQTMQWEIQGEPEHQSAQQAERQWTTEMEMALPRLGDVHAKLAFSANGLKLTIHAADSATMTLMNRSMPQLQSALAGINIPLISAAVEKS